MIACATGCGADALAGRRLCDECLHAYRESMEGRRAMVTYGPRQAVELTDFCNRTRAERALDNGVPRAE